MDDLTELAVSLAAGVGDVRGSLILSRDGLVLGAGPPDAEDLVKPAWVRFATLGEPERGFVQFGTEIWCYSARGAYAAFVVAGTSVRPGLVLDLIDQVLMTAEDARSRRDALRAPEPSPPPPAAPTSKPRSQLHPETKQTDRPPAVVRAQAVNPPNQRAEAEPSTDTPRSGPDGADGRAPEGVHAHTREDPAASGSEHRPAAHEPGPGVAGEAVSGMWSGAQMAAPHSVRHAAAEAEEPHVWATDRDAGDEEVDRFSLAREFSQLLQEGPEGADG